MSTSWKRILTHPFPNAVKQLNLDGTTNVNFKELNTIALDDAEEYNALSAYTELLSLSMTNCKLANLDGFPTLLHLKKVSYFLSFCLFPVYPELTLLNTCSSFSWIIFSKRYRIYPYHH